MNEHKVRKMKLGRVDPKRTASARARTRTLRQQRSLVERSRLDRHGVVLL